MEIIHTVWVYIICLLVQMEHISTESHPYIEGISSKLRNYCKTWVYLFGDGLDRDAPPYVHTNTGFSAV